MKIKKGQIRYYKIYTLDLVESDPTRVFIFGDNLARRGRKGQAIIRNFNNVIGVPTKRYPCMKSRKCFFSDKIDEMIFVRRELVKISELLKNGKKIGLPIDGLGTGLAELKKRSPVIFKYIVLFMRQYDSRYLKNIKF